MLRSGPGMLDLRDRGGGLGVMFGTLGFRAERMSVGMRRYGGSDGEWTTMALTLQNMRRYCYKFRPSFFSAGVYI